MLSRAANEEGVGVTIHLYLALLLDAAVSQILNHVLVGSQIQWMLNLSSAKRAVLLALLQMNIDFFIYLIPNSTQGTIER